MRCLQALYELGIATGMLLSSLLNLLLQAPLAGEPVGAAGVLRLLRRVGLWGWMQSKRNFSGLWKHAALPPAVFLGSPVPEHAA